MAGSRLAGRAPEVLLLSQWVDDVTAGLGRAALIEGEPGIGKSALLQAIREQAIAAGCAVFTATGEELGQAFPLLPLLHAFSFQPPSTDTAAAAESLLDRIDELSTKSPMALIIDDLHWADEATLAICRRLITSTAQRPLLLVAAMRRLPRRDDLQALRQSSSWDAVLRLEPLDRSAVAHLVAGLAGGAPGPSLERLAADAGGNPLYLTELIDALSRTGGLRRENGTAEVTGGQVPATLTEAISDRLDFLPHDVREVLQAAALLGSDFTDDDLVVVTGRKHGELEPALADAHAVGVLALVNERWAFRHPLIRTALYEDLPGAVRVAWHRDVARALYQAGAPIEGIARQLLPAVKDNGDQAAAPMPGIDEWVIDWLMEVSPALQDQMPAVAVELLTAAMHLAGPHDPRHGVLTSRLADGLVQLGRSDEAAKLVEGALPNVADPDLFTTLQMTLARCRADAGQFEVALTELAAAQNRPDLQPAQRALLRVRAARLLAFIGSTEAAEQAAKDALSWVGVDADAEITGNALLAMAANRAWLGDERGALELIDRALAVVEGHRHLSDLQLMASLYRGVELIVLDRVDDAEATLRSADRMVERTANLARRDVVQAWLVSLYFETGRWDDALGEGKLAGEHMPYMRCQVEGVGALIALHRDDGATARQHLAEAEPFAARLEGLLVGYLWLARALLLERSGDLAAALAVLRIEDGDLQEIEVWLPDAVRLAVTLDNGDAAQELARRAAALPSQDMVPHRAAASAYCRGLVDRDTTLLLHAAESYGTASRPLPYALALEEAAVLLAEDGDVDAARQPFATALATYARLGAEWNAARARARLRPHGLQQSRQRRRRATIGWDALTATEAKVADLVAIGLSNPEIAAQLVVSRRTVETHITKVLAKLQVRSRVDLARAAAVRSQSAGQ